MNRRNFFAFLPIAPVALMIDGARAAAKDQQPLDGDLTLTIQGSKRYMNRDPNSLGYGLPVADPHKKVSMSIGQDGNLWLKPMNGEWKKVVTE